METFESARTRTVLVRLDRGDRIRTALRDVADQHGIATAWVRGTGMVSRIELARSDAQTLKPMDAREYEHAELVSLEGDLCLEEGRVKATLRASARLHANGAMVGGAVVALTALAVELMLVVSEDVALERRPPEDGGPARWARVVAPEAPEAPEAPQAPEPASASAPSGGVSWADLASVSEEPPAPVPAPKKKPPTDPRKLRGYDPDGRRASRAARKQKRPATPMSMDPGFVPAPLPTKRRTTEEEFFEQPIPERGEWVDHKTFGLCRVDGESPDGGLFIRLPSGVRKSLRLDVLDVLEPRIEDEKIIYPVRPRRRS